MLYEVYRDNFISLPSLMKTTHLIQFGITILNSLFEDVLVSLALQGAEGVTFIIEVDEHSAVDRHSATV